MISGGPQSERDRRFWDEKADVPGIVRSDLVVNVGDEKRAYEGELSRIRRENISLKVNGWFMCLVTVSRIDALSLLVLTLSNS